MGEPYLVNLWKLINKNIENAFWSPDSNSQSRMSNGHLPRRWWCNRESGQRVQRTRLGTSWLHEACELEVDSLSLRITWRALRFAWSEGEMKWFWCHCRVEDWVFIPLHSREGRAASRVSLCGFALVSPAVRRANATTTFASWKPHDGTNSCEFPAPRVNLISGLRQSPQSPQSPQTGNESSKSAKKVLKNWQIVLKPFFLLEAILQRCSELHSEFFGSHCSPTYFF